MTGEGMRRRLEKRWLRLFKALINDRTPSTTTPVRAMAIFADLDSRYREPHRYYHTWHHIDSCLELFDEYRHLARNPGAVELALFYHDAVYIPGRPDNEIESARLLRRHAATLLPTDLVDVAARLVEATSIDDRREIDLDADVLLIRDIDFSILGFPKGEYDRYASSVRTEYSALDESSYIEGRIDFLNALIESKEIFGTTSFIDRFEQKARENLRRETKALRKRGLMLNDA